MRTCKDGELLVETSSGWAQGFLDRGVPNWRGVPYGQVGERFRPPSPILPTARIKATRWGPVGWQVPIYAGKSWTFIHPDSVESENCLNLNLWLPAPGRAGPPRPVMVWLHPGGHVYGCGSMPAVDAWVYAARHDAVAITANYRLGPWGWLYLGAIDPDYKDCTNLPILDQLLLLRWIRDNVAQFGGDPGNVTIFGASSGASDVATLLGVPAARGLFHKLAIYSGTAEDPMPLEESADFADRFLAAAGSLARTPSDLARLPNAGLRYIHRKMLKAGRVRYGPVIDGAVIPRPPLQSISEGLAAGVPALVSVTSDEAKMYDAFSRHAIDDMYVSHGGNYPDTEHDAKVNYLSQQLFIEPAKRLLTAINEAGGRAWAQVFDYLPTIAPANAYKGAAGRAVHGADLSALFIDPEGTAGNDTDRAVGIEEQAALTGLARAGEPGWQRVTPGSFTARWIGPPGAAHAGRGTLPQLSAETPRSSPGADMAADIAQDAGACLGTAPGHP